MKKTCEWCKKALPMSSFWRNVKSPDGKQSVCIECHVARGTGSPEQRGRVTPIKSADERRRRTSPYENMGEVLRQIERELNLGNVGTAQERIHEARAKYRIHA